MFYLSVDKRLLPSCWMRQTKRTILEKDKDFSSTKHIMTLTQIETGELELSELSEMVMKSEKVQTFTEPSAQRK